MCDNDRRRVIIIGSGLVGSLCACFMARRGYEVTVYEKREDMRLMKDVRGRSINLSLSHRGRKALRTVGLEDKILKAAVPMKGRLLHLETGVLKSVLYDPTFEQCIYSVDRNFLNRKLLEAAETYTNVRMNFNHKLIRSNFSEGTITVLDMKNREEIHRKADLIIGADGAYSKLRLAMQQTSRFQFSQEYIEHGYLELSISPNLGDKMLPNHLHIWPRGTFMMIALPNLDNSWTVTLFMPYQKFDMLENDAAILKFFQETFPDAVNLIGKEKILEAFQAMKPSQLISVRCSPYHIGSKYLLLGDAAHAMVPFFGQGMNAGFQDCSVLDELLDKTKDNIERTIREYSLERVANGHAICDLAMYNYIEMRDLVSRTSYHLRKNVDNIMFRIFPTMWIPLYNSVSFSTMDYTQCKENRKWQDVVIHTILAIAGLMVFVFLYYCSTVLW